MTEKGKHLKEVTRGDIMKNTADAVVIGTGFAGLCAAIKLKEKGMNFIVLEKDSGVGGVWRVNTYPGAQCDVQSHLYSFSFEHKSDWSRTYGMQKEILEYMEHCSSKYGINPHIRFNTEAVDAKWNDSEKRWEIRTDKGDIIQAKYAFFGLGGLSQIVLPDIKGREKFKGKFFHSAKWDHSADVKGKKVAVIGSAASAIQIVPAIASKVKKLTVFQRTASWILPKEDRPYSNIEKNAFQMFPPLQWASREAIYWRLEARAMAFVYTPAVMKAFQRLIEKHIRNCVKDPVLAAKLTPDYTIGCKRILLSNDYYPALQRSNVDLVTEGIAEMDENGIILKDGSRVDADIIVAATGFKAAEDILPFPVLGKNGISLNDEWKNGPEAYLGTTVKGFPNMFMIVGPNTGLGHSSMVYMIESQVNYAMKAVEYLQEEKLNMLEVKPDIQEEFNKEVQSRLGNSVWNNGGCVSWYRTKDGKNTTLWPGFTFEFRNRTENFQPKEYILK